MAGGSPDSFTRCTASPPIQRATFSQPKHIAGSACRNSFTKGWRRSRRKIRASSGHRASNFCELNLVLNGAVMQKLILSFLAFAAASVLSLAGRFSAQPQGTPPTTQHLPRGTATDVSNSEIQSLVQKTAADR